MSKIIEDMVKEELAEERMEIATRMLEDGVLPLEKIAKYLKLSPDEVKKLQAAQNT